MGTIGKIAKFTSSSAIDDSVITESSAKIGIGTASPAATLDVEGSAAFLGPGPWADVKAHGAVGDGTTNDAAAIQAAIDSLPTSGGNPGGIVYLPPGSYNLGSTSLLIKGIGQQIVGAGGEASRLIYTGSDFAIKNNGTSVRTRVRLAHFQIDGTNSPTNGMKAVDFTYFSNSTFEHLALVIKGNNTRGFYGVGTDAAASPYYNVFFKNDIQMDNILTTSGSVGYYFDQHATSDEGPNANLVMAGRISGGDKHLRILQGHGNQFIGINSESCKKIHCHLGIDVVAHTGTATSATSSTLTDSAATFPGSNGLANAAIKITGGTGSGQIRWIDSNTSTQVTVASNWTTTPDSTSTYTIYDDVGAPGYVTAAADATVTFITRINASLNLFRNAAVKIFDGTGSGQVRRITSSTAATSQGGSPTTYSVQLTLESNWRTLPASSPASWIVIYPFSQMTSDFIALRAEGSNDTNPDFMRIEPGADSIRIVGGEVGSIGSGKVVRSEIWRNSDSLNPIAYKDIQAFTFVKSTVAATQADVQMLVGGSAITQVPLMYDADIVGIALRASGPRTAGTLTVTPSISVTTVSNLSARMDGNTVNYDFQTQPIGTESLGGLGRTLGVLLTTDSFAPTAIDLSVTVFILPKG